ncbi:hypothetical protein OUZ56_013470 [Daphnia magna]|uniref:Tryptophan 5-hydroxylase 2 n=1 Tax=Daphnia magna TaxID=35525 RepID=A0ABQ9Z603_9CRUS|nr:hypothetical protein OUZ56_013470 [Daphnia magna]
MAQQFASDNIFHVFLPELLSSGFCQGTIADMSGSGKGLLGLWLYRMGEEEWKMKDSYHGDREMTPKTDTKTNTMIFSLKNQPGGLARALKVFQAKRVNVVHIESRPSMRRNSQYEIMVDVQCNDDQMTDLIASLQNEVAAVKLAEFDMGLDPPMSPAISESFENFENMIWFPRRISELDQAQRVLLYGADLDADHPGFKDPVYRKRRKYFTDLAMAYRYGEPIPRVEYTPEEIKTWGVIFCELHKLYPVYACKEYLENWPQLVKYCGYRQDNIPQQADLNNFLKRKTGFTIRPVAGYLSPRDFLAGLAFRVFHCTQYIRHSSDPFYTPEPDCCHELLGHMPLLANPSFAQFSQEIGLASLGATDEEVTKLATCYFFTVEFGLCKENGALKVYGAGLLSSIAELRHALSEEAKPKIKLFDPEVTAREECIITSFQNAYYFSESFEESKEKMRKFAATIKRPFGIRYNPYTQSVEVLSSAEKIVGLMSELRGDLCIVHNALQKIHEQDDSINVDQLASILNKDMPI